MSVPPTVSGSGLSLLVRARSAAAGISATVVVAVARLLVVTVSTAVPSVVTVAVLLRSPGSPVVAVIVTVAEAPLARLPRLQVTVPPAWPQLPCEGVGEANVTVGGRVSRHGGV